MGVVVKSLPDGNWVMGLLDLLKKNETEDERVGIGRRRGIERELYGHERMT